MSITVPEGVIVGTSKTTAIISGAYTAVWVAALVFGPLIFLHGYRTWWVVTYYAALASVVIGGSISHYQSVLRKR